MPSAFVKNWTVPVWGLFGLALLALMYFAKPILIPAVIALLTALMLAPVVHLFERVMPPAVAAFLILAMFVAGVSVVLNYTVDPMRLWLERLPAEMLTLESKLSSVKRSIESVKDTTERIGDLATLASSRDDEQDVVVSGPNIFSALLASTQSFIIGVISYITLLYFFMAAGNALFDDSKRLFSRSPRQQALVEIARLARSQVSRYLLLHTTISALLGLAVTVAMWLTNMPNPIVWGVGAFVLNYIPYIGPITNVVVVALVALLSFEDSTMALLPPVCVAVLHLIEGQIFQPLVYGRVFVINPIVVFLCILLMGFLWGVAGVVITVPMLVIAKIVYEETARVGRPQLAIGSDTRSHRDELLVGDR